MGKIGQNCNLYPKQSMALHRISQN